MPPLKKALSRNFSRNASGLLIEKGHGRLLVFGDSGLDVPDTAQVFYYLGNTRGDISVAAAFTEVEDACPLDKDVPVNFMLKDEKDDAERPAPDRNKEIIEGLGFKAVGLVKDGKGGFYEVSNGADPARPPIYCLTASKFAYDCIIATIGHSQV